MQEAQLIPPFAGVSLVEYRDRIELRPYYWCREFFGLGRIRGCDVPEASGSIFTTLFRKLFWRRKVWVIVCWRRYEDGREEALRIQYLSPEVKEDEARRMLGYELRFTEQPREELESLLSCFAATPDDVAYVESRPSAKDLGLAGAEAIEDADVYQARLKALAGLAPQTVSLIFQADSTTDEADKTTLERKAVDAFFADLAHHWTDAQIQEWQRSNPVGAEWITQFARVKESPQRDLDPINYELALNWLRKKYNLLTAEELAVEIHKATGQRITAAAIKKRRERLGLTTKRPTGPRPKSES